ncbi:MAG TPA: zinc-dependent metalloprotease [Albitalea sp.]|uniref:zinc-dependent metalloprotease n=1 Tax=Piscinibacter sp. TaxID=1903157 RepID=UPI002ED00F4C
MKYLRSRRPLPIVVSPALVALLAGCASVMPVTRAAAGPDTLRETSVTPVAATAAAPAASAVSRSAPNAAQAAAGGLRPFAEVIKDAKRIDGLFTLWQKDDKVWLELKPTDLDQAFFLSPKVKTGIGESRFYGGLMAEEVVVEFRRVHNQLQLLARNTEFVAKPDTPNGRAVEAAFSPSLLASTSVLSLPHPERKSILVEANALFVNDLLGTGMQLQRAYRQGYSLDTRNSAITDVRATPELVVLEVLTHFSTGSIQTSQGSFGNAPSVPKSLPDPRSMFMTLHYSLARLPEQPMKPRKADGRVGYFTSAVMDFSDDLARTPRQRYVNRWRLEKKDPSAALSEPVKPITFWLDKTIPEKYRAPITAGVLEWNKAFERIGFKNAVRVEVQPADADWDTLDFGRASIRWMTNSSPTFGAIGPSHVDPRSGEILDADIGVESLSSRNQRALRAQVLGAPRAAEGESHQHENAAVGLRGKAIAMCEFADQAAEQLSYALDVLEARGDLDPSSPEAEKFVHDYLKDVTMHEVGHTLGLRHNFRSSRIYTDKQLADPVFTATHGISGSVMEYAAINLAAPDTPRDKLPAPFNTTLGPYDYWAIEYAYKPLPTETENAELAKIAARSAEPALAYGTDEDNFLGVDPESLQFDLGSDAVAFARKRVVIARDLLARQEKRELGPDQDYSVLRRSVSFALRDMGRAAGILTRQIGGVRTLRDHAGSGRDPLTPVPAGEQRAALDVLATGFLSADSFALSPALQRKLALDFQERTDAVFRGEGAATTDFSLASQVIELQRGVIAQLLSDTVASRLLDSESKSPKDALRLSELYGRLDKSVWSELGTRGDIPALRRELQREHVNRVANTLLRPASLSRADARSLLRAQAHAMLTRIQAASKRSGLSPEAKAHLQDSADTLTQALNAKMERAGA